MTWIRPYTEFAYSKEGFLIQRKPWKDQDVKMISLQTQTTPQHVCRHLKAPGIEPANFIFRVLKISRYLNNLDKCVIMKRKTSKNDPILLQWLENRPEYFKSHESTCCRNEWSDKILLWYREKYTVGIESWSRTEESQSEEALLRVTRALLSYGAAHTACFA